MKLKDPKVARAISYKVGKFNQEHLEKEDFLKVEEISLNNRGLSGELHNIRLDDLSLLPNLKMITLQYFVLDDAAIDLLNSIPKLGSLHLASCDYRSNKELKNQSVRTLILQSCKASLDKVNATENFYIVSPREELDLSKLKGKRNIKKLFVQKSKIKGVASITECDNLETLNLDGSTLDDEKVLDSIKPEVKVSKKDNYTPIR